MKGARGGVLCNRTEGRNYVYQELAKGGRRQGNCPRFERECLCSLRLFLNVIKTKEFSALEPDVVENKYYASNVGELKEKTLKGSKEGIAVSRNQMRIFNQSWRNYSPTGY